MRVCHDTIRKRSKFIHSTHSLCRSGSHHGMLESPRGNPCQHRRFCSLPSCRWLVPTAHVFVIPIRPLRESPTKLQYPAMYPLSIHHIGLTTAPSLIRPRSFCSRLVSSRTCTCIDIPHQSARTFTTTQKPCCTSTTFFPICRRRSCYLRFVRI